MKIAAILLFLLISGAFASQEAFLFAEGPKLPRASFEAVIRSFDETFSPYAQERGYKLEIMADYNTTIVNAFARRWETDQLIVYGGIATIPHLTEDTLALVLCHELGHLYGGEPYRDEATKVSIEGQADYWATNVCFKLMAPVDTYARALAASAILTAYLSHDGKTPSLATPDLSRAAATNMGHPGGQCRFDTMIAGILDQPRPCCWYFCR